MPALAAGLLSGIASGLMLNSVPVGLCAALVSWFAISIDLAGLWLYQSSAADGEPSYPAASEGMGLWPAGMGGSPSGQLAVISAAGLFLELLMIRWISSDIPVFAYFKNFVLIACYLGFGLGCYLCRRALHWSALILPLIALTVICELPLGALRNVVNNLPNFIGASSQVDFWGVPHLPLDALSLLALAGALAFVIPIFGLIALAFLPIGQLVGWYLDAAGDGIRAYTVNVVGSLAGILLFTLLCFLFLPPAVWLLIAGAMLSWFARRAPRLRWSLLASFTLCAGLSAASTPRATAVYWSPYQKLSIAPVVRAGEVISYRLSTNANWYQQIFNLSPGFEAAHPELFAKVPAAWNPYNLPYRFYPHPASVLVLGAGTGNDVAAALRNGAGQVTAVEIDPLILRLGRELHFEKPYSSPRVKVAVNDARSFIENSRRRFDFIVFSLLDSHTSSSYYSSIRIDNYVYTVEALTAARRLLKPGGLMIIKFAVTTPWIGGRLREAIRQSFGQDALRVDPDPSPYTTSGSFFVFGSRRRLAQALSDPQLAAYVAAHGGAAMSPAIPTTDDWPFFYQRAPGLPVAVIVVSAVLFVLCWSSARAVGAGLRSVRWHFFFLGAGFLLLEAQIVSRMALLFGTTWIVNSIAISGLLVLIVAANLLVAAWRRIPVALGYAGIFLTIAFSYVFPLETLLRVGLWERVWTAILVLCLPVFFAGLVFVRGFARERFRAEALGSNLLGALVGGLLESISMWSGIRALLLLAAMLYAASCAALWQAPDADGRVPSDGKDRAPA